MPNSHPDDQPVTWGRYAEAQTTVQRRLDKLDESTGAQSTRIETNERTLANVKDRFEQLYGQYNQRRQRSWSLGTILLASLLLPLLVTAISIWLNVR